MRLPDWLRRPSRIGRRLFAFNLLVLFVPVAGILYLDVYESRLLATQERGMIQQARMLAASLDDGEVVAERAMSILSRLEDHGDSRIRVYDTTGRLIADSARVAGRPQMPPPGESYAQVTDPRRRVLYKVGAGLAHVRGKVTAALRGILGRGGNKPTTEGSPPGMLPEVRAALTRGYGAASRQTAGQRSLTLSSAVPIRAEGQVLGAVVVSQSTFRILQALYDVRLRLFEIVLLSLGFATVLTLVASSTIVNPLLRLQQAAAGLTGRSGALGGAFIQVKRKDEIGDLARSLEQLAARLDAHIKLLESFAADVAHEFRNPLTAIRTAAETVADTDSAEERRRFLGMLLKDVDRLDKLVSGVRELASIDTQLSTASRDRINLSDLLRTLVAGRGQVVPTPLKLQLPAAPLFVLGSPDRLWQVFENLIDNAAGFSPPGAEVEISAVVQSGSCVVTVADRGPGIPDEHLARVFERFFSYRPGSDRREHMGLGLAIAQAVVAGYGGGVAVRNRVGGGAEFEVRLPLAVRGGQAP